jgi:cytochrome c oxidase assembly protein Cox11
METDTGGKKAIAMFMAMLMVGMAFAAVPALKLPPLISWTPPH